MILQPTFLRCTPPAMMTPKPTSVASSTTTVKDIRKPTDFHVWQKFFLSPIQSVALGNASHVPFTLEQNLWRPKEFVRLSSC